MDYYLTGNARLNREIGRTWNAALGYIRSVSYIATYGEPFFSDAVNATLGGMINRRLQFRSGARASLGSVGAAGNSNYDTYYGSTGVTYALSRYVGLSTSTLTTDTTSTRS